MKKQTFLISFLSIIGILVSFNIYLLSSNKFINNSIENNNSTNNMMYNLSTFRLDITKTSQAERLYLLTSNKRYLLEYKESLDNLYLSFSQLHSDGIIDKAQFTDLMNSLDEYSSSSGVLVNDSMQSVIDYETENAILASNKSQLELLSVLDDYASLSTKAINKSNLDILNTSNNQIGSAYLVSTTVTSIISFLMYLLKKFITPKQIVKVINCLDDSDDEKDKEQDIVLDNHLDVDLVLLDEKITNSENILNIINVFYEQSSNLNSNLDKCNIIISNLRRQLTKLSLESDTCSGYAQSLVDDIQDQFAELMVQFESLPIYNDFLSDLYSVLNSKNSKK